MDLFDLANPLEVLFWSHVLSGIVLTTCSLIVASIAHPRSDVVLLMLLLPGIDRGMWVHQSRRYSDQDEGLPASVPVLDRVAPLSGLLIAIEFLIVLGTTTWRPAVIFPPRSTGSAAGDLVNMGTGLAAITM